MSLLDFLCFFSSLYFLYYRRARLCRRWVGRWYRSIGRPGREGGREENWRCIYVCVNFVTAMIRHLNSLRRMKRDHGTYVRLLPIHPLNYPPIYLSTYAPTKLSTNLHRMDPYLDWRSREWTYAFINFHEYEETFLGLPCICRGCTRVSRWIWRIAR